MNWKFYHVPDGLKDWPDQAKGTEYIQYYVEREPGIRVGYLGYGKQIHVFEYARGNLGFKFDVVATNVVKNTGDDDRKRDRQLGPKCKVWIYSEDIARMSADVARKVVSDIADVLLSGVLLSRTPHSDLLGPPIEDVVFASAELEQLNSKRGIGK